MSEDLVLVKHHGPVAVVSFNRPRRLNAFDQQTLHALHAALTQIADLESCRVVVLTGEGRAFSAGVDLESGLGGASPGAVQRTYKLMRLAVKTVLLMRDMPQPIIAAVNGHCVGGGFALATACDLRVADADASFNPVFVRLGMSIGDLGLSWMLPRLIGHSAAVHAFYTGRIIAADEALRLGLVTEVGDSALETALAMAAQIADRAPFAVRISKELMNSSIGTAGLRQHLELELRSQVITSMTEEFAEGVAAFVERRPARFTDS